jgi:xanthosine utilization system XapX-like protein
MNATIMDKTSSGRISTYLLFLPLMGFVARLCLGLARLDQPMTDPDQYLPFAQSLWLGEGFVYNGLQTAYRPPLYPVLLAPIVGLIGTETVFQAVLLVVQSVLGAITVWLAMSISRTLLDTFQERYASLNTPVLFAGIWTAFDPVLVMQASLPMTETLAAVLVTFGLFWSIRNKFITAGVVFGLAGLCRPSLLACSTLVILARLVAFNRTEFKRNLFDCLKMGTAIVVVICPWAIRNWMIFGEPVWTTTHGGYTFALANNPVYYEDVLFGPPGSVWTDGPRQQAWMESIGPATVGLTEPEADRRLKSITWEFIKFRPIDFLYACLDRQLRFWAVAPSAVVYSSKVRLVSALWTVPFWMLAVLGGIGKKSWKWPNLAVISSIAGLSAVHSVYWTDIRMRAPIVPAVAILGSLGMSYVVGQKLGRRESHS